jgi:hypothetical protein
VLGKLETSTPTEKPPVHERGHREARAGISAWIEFYDSRRLHPGSVTGRRWQFGVTGTLHNGAADTTLPRAASSDSAGALGAPQ